MKIGLILASIAVFALAAGLLILAIRHFREKGYLLNNAYIFASREEREAMDKKPWYRQSAIVFLLLSAVFAVIGLSLMLNESKIQLLEIPLFAAVFVYAIVSTLRIEKRSKKGPRAAPRLKNTQRTIKIEREGESICCKPGSKAGSN